MGEERLFTASACAARFSHHVVEPDVSDHVFSSVLTKQHRRWLVGKQTIYQVLYALKAVAVCHVGVCVPPASRRPPHLPSRRDDAERTADASPHAALRLLRPASARLGPLLARQVSPSSSTCSTR